MASSLARIKNESHLIPSDRRILSSARLGGTKLLARSSSADSVYKGRAYIGLTMGVSSFYSGIRLHGRSSAVIPDTRNTVNCRLVYHA